MKNKDRPAYPVPLNEGETLGAKCGKADGLTKREWFAGMAMQAIVSNPAKDGITRGKNGVPLIVKYAYEYADAMLEGEE